MSENWAFDLDMLAHNNVLDFDAPAYVREQRPRYVGSPAVMPSPFGVQQPDTSNLEQPQNDEFKPAQNNKELVKNPAWKKFLFGALALGGLGFAGWKFRSKLVPKNFDFNKVKQFCTDKAKVVGDFFKDGWEKVKGFFTRKPANNPAP